jgi:hypothetical protein
MIRIDKKRSNNLKIRKTKSFFWVTETATKPTIFLCAKITFCSQGQKKFVIFKGFDKDRFISVKSPSKKKKQKQKK